MGVQEPGSETCKAEAAEAGPRELSFPIYVQAWAGEEPHHAQTESVDCAVEVQVSIQGQTPVKAPAASAHHPPGYHGGAARHGRARCCMLTLLVLGLLTAGVLVPIAVVLGLKRDIDPVYRVLQPPAPAARLVFAFEGGVLAPQPADALPPHVAGRLLSWAALPTSGLHVAAFEDATSLQQALAAMAAAGAQGPIRGSSSSGSTTTNSSSLVLKYAVSDFRLLPDRRLTHAIDPMQLFELSRGQGRQLAMQEQQQQSWQRRRLLSQWPRAGAPAASALLLPDANLPTAAGEPLPQLATEALQLQPSDAAATRTAGAAGAPGAAASNGPSSRQRLLLQDVSSLAAAEPAAPKLQLQQKQAQYQVQRGGSGVAWYLADQHLAVRDAWNVTTGLDRLVVAVIDSGVELTSGSVGPSVWANAAEVAADGIDNDGNGYVDDVMGWDFGGSCADAACSSCLAGPDPTDTTGWGTHAASVVAGQPEVPAGTSGIAPGVRIMPLKVADCRAGGQLWDVVAQQQQQQQAPPAGGAAEQQQQLGAGPVLLGSAAVQALDYALVNGAHIVLAAWQAGGLLDSSNSSSNGSSNGGQCFLGAAAAAQLGVGVDVAQGGAGCTAAAQRLLFADALQPLQEAGVLVITMQASSSGSSSSSGEPQPLDAAAPPLPCSLACELDNVLCVAASDAPPTTTPATRATGAAAEAEAAGGAQPSGTLGAVRGGLQESVPAADFFRPLVTPPGSPTWNWGSSATLGAAASGSDGSSSSSGDGDVEDPGLTSGLGSRNGGGGGGASSSAARLAALQCSSAGSSGRWAQLSAAGTDILAGWAWGGHAALSGGSAAASVTAGAAALAWSKLGQTLGAAASSAALEGLGPAVRQLLLEGSSISTSRGGSGGGGGGSDADRAGHGAAAALQGTVTAAARSAAAGAVTSPTTTANVSSSTSSSREPERVPLPQLDVMAALQRGSGDAVASGMLRLQPLLLGPAATTASRGLRLTWYISNDDSGAYDTSNMWFVSRKAIRPPSALPITAWEFFGATSLVELTGHVSVTSPGPRHIALLSRDSCALWLQDSQLQLQPAAAAAAAGEAAARALAPEAWVARVNFSAPGFYKLRLLVYSPSKPLDLQWRPHGSSSPFSSISQLVSFGQAQPLPQQLLEAALLPLAARGDAVSERSSRTDGAAVLAKQRAVAKASDAGALAAAPAGSNAAPAPSTTRAAAAQPSDGNSGAAADRAVAGAPGSPMQLPDSPGGSSSSQGSSTSADAGAAPPGSAEDSSSGDELSSNTASLDPSGELSPEWELQGAAPAPSTDDGTAAATPWPPAPAPDSGLQLQPQYDGGGSGDGGFDGFLSSLSGLFGGLWGSSRRLLAVPQQQTQQQQQHQHTRALLAGGDVDRGSSSSATGSSMADSQLLMQKAEHYDRRRLLGGRGLGGNNPTQQRQRANGRALAAASAAADAAGRRAEAPSQRSSSSSGTWGRFSLAMSFAEKTPYRTLMPPLAQLTFTHTGILPAPGFSITAPMQLQQEVLGYSDDTDARGCYGMVQGWLDWRDLNPAAAAAITAASSTAGSPASASGITGSGGSSGGGGGGASISTEGAAVALGMGGVHIGSAGVQFELVCDACSLHIDGMTVAGSLGAADASACITPVHWAAAAGRSSGGSDTGSASQARLLHLQVLFTSNDVRATRLQVRSRPCTLPPGSSGAGAGDGDWAPLAAAGASPAAFGLSAAAIRAAGSGAGGGGGGSPGHLRGMLCSVRADLAPSTAAAAGAGSNSSSPGSDSEAVSGRPGTGTTAGPGGGQGLLHRTVFLSAQELRDAVKAMPGSGNATITGSSSGGSSGSSRVAATPRSTVDTPGGDAVAGAAAGRGGGSSSSSSNGTSSDDGSSGGMDSQEASEEAAAEREAQRQRDAQLAAAKAAAGARGISVALLAPDWAAQLPSTTLYSLSCSAFWNGSWPGNVTVGVTGVPALHARGGSAGTGSSAGGAARLFLAGWPLAARPLASLLYGPSDLDVAGYSTSLQRAQLRAGAGSADPLAEEAPAWAEGLLLSGSGSGISSGGDGGPLGGRFPSSLAGLVAGAAAASPQARRAVLPGGVVRTYRALRLAAAAAGRPGGAARAGGSGGSSGLVVGLLPLGAVDGVGRRAVMARSGWMQLLTLQASGLAGDSQVVVLAPGQGSDGSGSGGSSSSHDDGGTGDGGFAAVPGPSSWLPDVWDAWVPAA